VSIEDAAFAGGEGNSPGMVPADPVREAVARALGAGDEAAPQGYLSEADRLIAAFEASGIRLVKEGAAGLEEAWRAVEEALPEGASVVTTEHYELPFAFAAVRDPSVKNRLSYDGEQAETVIAWGASENPTDALDALLDGLNAENIFRAARLAEQEPPP
jgi:hypothetical protein